MSNRLPSELLDTIVDFLHDSRDALKSCCLTSKSWIPRTRTYLFADIRFYTVQNVESWKTTFPDPSTSPAHYAKTLLIAHPRVATAKDAEEGGWIQTFFRVVHLEVNLNEAVASEFVNHCLVPFHGFSPAIRSLRLVYIPLPLPLIFNLIHSFPHLEDLSVITRIGVTSNGGFNIQPVTAQFSSPRTFTGFLELYGVNPIASQLLSLPGGLHFRKIRLAWHHADDILSTKSLVESCSTLESLCIDSGISEPINLSKATKLREVVFICRSSPMSGPRWVLATLKTTTSYHRDLQQISFKTPYLLFSSVSGHVHPTEFRRSIGESARQVWSELDRLLAQLSELRQIRLKVLYGVPMLMGEEKAKRAMESLLPEVTARGMVEMIGGG